jgi:hypothetical protein
MSYLYTKQVQLTNEQISNIKASFSLNFEPEFLRFIVEYSPSGNNIENDMDYILYEFHILDEHAERKFFIRNEEKVISYPLSTILDKFFPEYFNRIKMEKILWNHFDSIQYEQ